MVIFIVTWLDANQLNELASQVGLKIEKLYGFPFGGIVLGNLFYFFLNLEP